MGPFHNILVATDFSPDSARAVELAKQLATSFGAKLTLAHVCQLPAYAFFDGSMYAPTPELVGDIRRDAKRELAAARASLGEMKAETVLLEGEPAAELVRYAQSHGIDLVLMGTHGRRGVRRLVLGSVAERVVRTAGCPVLTTRSAEPPTIAGSV